MNDKPGTAQWIFLKKQMIWRKIFFLSISSDFFYLVYMEPCKESIAAYKDIYCCNCLLANTQHWWGTPLKCLKSVVKPCASYSFSGFSYQKRNNFFFNNISLEYIGCCPFPRKSVYNRQAGLSWESVPAEAVRLQKQIESGLMDIHLKFTEFCSEE